MGKATRFRGIAAETTTEVGLNGLVTIAEISIHTRRIVMEKIIKRSMTPTMRNMLERTKEAAGPVGDRFLWSEPQSRRRTDYGQFAKILDSNPDGINLFLDTCSITSHE